MDAEKQRDEIVARLSKRVENGWTLMQRTCPECNTPLVSQAATTDGSVDIFCCGCQIECRMASALSAATSSTSSPPAAAPTTTPTPATSSADAEAAEMEALVAKFKAEAAQHERAADTAKEREGAAASAALGEWMLKGWTLLDQMCPVGCDCPLLRAPASGTKTLCVQCTATSSSSPSSSSSPAAAAAAAAATLKAAQVDDMFEADVDADGGGDVYDEIDAFFERMDRLGASKESEESSRVSR
jgi:uncharacterized Zn finger protein (UPF0148 family)